MITMRPEKTSDIFAVRKINRAAFESTAEGAIIDTLSEGCPDRLSLVAEKEGRIVGYIFFSPVVIDSGNEFPMGMGLAPMAVLPERQRQGIGSLLVREGIEALRERECPFIIVLGHPEYYPRFGFVPASRHGLSCQWDGVPDEVFMALVLDQDAMKGISGTARYREEFNQAM